MLTEAEKSHLEALERRLEEPRPKMYQPGIPAVVVRKYGVQRLSKGYPVARFMDTLKGGEAVTHGHENGKPVLYHEGKKYDPWGRRIIGSRSDEERAKSEGAVEE